MLHGFKYVFVMINEGQIHTCIISKEFSSMLFLSSALPLSLNFLIQLSKFKNEFINLVLLVPY